VFWIPSLWHIWASSSFVCPVVFWGSKCQAPFWSIRACCLTDATVLTICLLLQSAAITCLSRQRALTGLREEFCLKVKLPSTNGRSLCLTWLQCSFQGPYKNKLGHISGINKGTAVMNFLILSFTWSFSRALDHFHWSTLPQEIQIYDKWPLREPRGA
jgi:hypothetical protein